MRFQKVSFSFWQYRRAYFKDKQLVGQTYEKGPKTVKAYPRPDHTHENLLATVPFIYGIGPGWFIIF